MKHRFLLLLLTPLLPALFCCESVAYDVLYKGSLPVPPPDLRISEDTVYTAFAGGIHFGLVLIEDGTIDVWGNSVYLNTNTISSLEDVSAIAACGHNAIALKTDGSVSLIGSYYTFLVPDQLSDVVAIDISYDFALALKNDGSVVSWGYDDDWQFGLLDVPAGLADVIAVAAGGGFSIALISDGSIVSWGESDFGKIDIPSKLSDVIAIDAGDNHAVALRKDGTVVAWGNNDLGQLDIPAELRNVVKISSAGGHTLALKDDGTVVAWGDNEFGQTDVPSDLSDVSSVAAGFSHSVAIKSGGSVIGWGNNDYGKLTGSYKKLRGIKTIVSSEDHVVALRNDGTVVAWGSPHNFSQSAIASELNDVVAIATNSYLSVAQKSDGSIIAWDAYTYERYNNERYENFNNFENILSISVNFYQLIFLKSDNSLATFDIFPPFAYDIPNTPASVKNVFTVLAAQFHTIALVEPSTAVIWGQVPNTNVGYYREVENVKAIATGHYHCIFLMNDGTIQVVPLEPFSDSNPLGTHVPDGYMPEDLSGVTSIVSGAFHAVALKEDGSVTAWGSNTLGQTNIPSDLTNLVAISASDQSTFYYFPDGALSGCIVNDVIFTQPYFPSVGENFVFGMNTESYLYTGFCPFVYDFKTSDWWYVYEGNINPNNFWIYSYNSAAWKFVLSGYTLDI